MSKAKSRRTPNAKTRKARVRKTSSVGKTKAMEAETVVPLPPGMRIGPVPLPWMSLRDFAKLLDKSTSTISAWCEAGMPHEQPGKSQQGFVIRLEAALPWVMQHALTPPLESQRERLAREQADKVAIENALSRGHLMQSAQVSLVLQQLVATHHAQRKTMKARCVHEFCGIADPIRMGERFDEEFSNFGEAMAAVTGSLADACERAAEDSATVDAASASLAGRVGRHQSRTAQG